MNFLKFDIESYTDPPPKKTTTGGDNDDGEDLGSKRGGKKSKIGHEKY